MSSDIPESDEFSANLAQRIIERLARAKWIAGAAYVSPRVVDFQLTDLGNRKVSKLAKYLKPFEDCGIVGATLKASTWDGIKVLLALRFHGLMLFKWPLPSKEEELLMIALLAQEAAKLRARH